MDSQTFDRLVADAARHPNRRTTLRLLAGGLLGALIPGRAGAQRSDRDEDGLFDDDETDVYGTNPDDWDTDDDNVGDGEEIYNQDNGLGGPRDPLVNNNPAPPPPDPAPPAATCTGFGGPCAAQSNCCGYEGTGVLCCFDANGAGVCTDVAALGTFLCPAPGVPDTGCAVGLTNCGGFCTDLSTDHGNCGACGQRCSQVCGPDCNCVNATCTQYCSPGLTSCNGVCANVMTDASNCGVCGNRCGLTIMGYPRTCSNGHCSLEDP